MDLESERILEEEAARRRGAQAAERTRELEDRRRREEEEQRSLLEENARRRADFERREEAARLAAIAQAEIEKAHHLAENELRVRILAQSQEHEQALTRLHADRAKVKLRRLVVASLLAAAGALVFGYLWVDAAKRDAHAKLARMEVEAVERRRAFDEQIQHMTEKVNQLGANDALKRQQMQREIEVLTQQKALDVSSPVPRRPDRKNDSGPVRQVLPSSEPRCQEGDPMCPL
jgi:colicin import membrane protein